MAIPLGNVKTQSLKEIYFSKTSEAFKRDKKMWNFGLDVIDVDG